MLENTHLSYQEAQPPPLYADHQHGGKPLGRIHLACFFFIFSSRTLATRSLALRSFFGAYSPRVSLYSLLLELVDMTHLFSILAIMLACISFAE